MALTIQALSSDQLIKQRKGFISVSYTAWTATTVDSMCAGSVFEDADSVYYATADETIDGTATLAGLGNSWVYVYFDPATLGLYCSASAPAWDDAKQGHYLAASPTHRCVLVFLKLGAGNYVQKYIPMSRELRDTNTGIYVDYKSMAGGADLLLKTYTSVGAGSDTAFTIKKPVACFLASSVVGPANGAYVELQYSIGWIRVYSAAAQLGIAEALVLVPGTYRLTNMAAGTTNLWAVGCYGSSSLILSEIVA